MNAGGEFSIGVQKPTADLAAGGSLSSFAPGLGMFLAISAIFFAYDGFYVAAGIQSEMEEPKKTPMAILLGLVFTTVIYLIIAISMSINGGSFSDMLDYMETLMPNVGHVLFGIVNIMIAIGVLGIINGFAMWAPRFTEDLIKEGELPLSIKYKDKLNEHKPKVGIMYSFVITIPIVIVFTLIGALAYIDNYAESSYGSGMGKLYTFADLMGTWTALFTFGFITAAIYGGIKNRKTQKVQTDQKSYFVPMAIIAVIIVGLALTVTILIPIFDLLLIAQLDQVALEAKGVFSDIIVSRIMLVITLIIFIALSYGTTWIEDRINIKKFGSIEKYEAWQKLNFIVS